MTNMSMGIIIGRPTGEPRTLERHLFLAPDQSKGGIFVVVAMRHPREIECKFVCLTPRVSNIIYSMLLKIF